MSERSNARDIAIGVVAVVVIIGGAVWFDSARDKGEDDAGVEVVASAEPANSPSAAPTVESAPVVDTVDVSATEEEPAIETAAPEVENVAREADTTAEDAQQVADVAPAPEEEPAVETALDDTAPDVASDPIAIAPMAPSIDTFFRNPDETTIIAGRATPGQTVAIMLGQDELDRVETAADGTFGTIVFIAAADQPRRLRVIGDPDGEEIASAESVIVPPSAPLAVADAPTQALPEAVIAEADDSAAVQVDAASSDPVVVSSEVSGGQAPVIDAESPAAPTLIAGGAPVAATPPTLIADADGVRVLQRPDPDASKPAFLDNIALDTITYDTKGEVILAGRAASEGFVQVYLDNQPITTSRISDGGDWQIDLPDVDTGVYTLRVDEVDSEGNVTSRIETPFKREEPETVAAIMADDTSVDGFDVAVRTVQPGATLWAIAEEQFGAGILYVSVFEANRDQIRDPDLIYPGQVFRIPEIAE